MQNKKKLVKKVDTKKPLIKKDDSKSKEELEELFNFNFGCDCSSCHHHCGDEK